MTDKLSLFNSALLKCGERSLASLSEERESRRNLDQVWSDGGIDYCLECGQWFFAMRTIQIDYDTSVTPDFGYSRAFSKPTDWILTSAICIDELFTTPLLRYFDETQFWYSDYDTMYVRYVSNDSTYGQDLNKWPESFRDFVAADFALRIISKQTGINAAAIEMKKKERKEALEFAKNRCAMADSTKFPAQGSWTASRQRSSSRRDGGRINGPLIG